MFVNVNENENYHPQFLSLVLYPSLHSIYPLFTNIMVPSSNIWHQEFDFDP